MVKGQSRERVPTLKWKILMALCEGHGACGWRIGGIKTFQSFKSQVSGLRKILRNTFGIEEDPFLNCSRAGGLRSAFRASPPPAEAPYVGEDQWEGWANPGSA